MIPVVFALLALAPTATAEDLQALVERLRPSVVTLEARDLRGQRTGSGTGFFIAAEGLIATNHHVAAMSPTSALLADGSRHEVLGLLMSDETKDLAILRVEGGGYPALPLGAAILPARGDQIVVIGSPLGLDQTVSEGIISALWPTGLPEDQGGSVIPKCSLLQVSAPISPGSSGSPVLARDGRVIGIAQSVTDVGFGSSAAFAVDVTELQALIARAPADGALTPLQSPLRLMGWSLALVGAVVTAALGPSAWGWAKGGWAEGARRRRRGVRPGPPPPAP